MKLRIGTSGYSYKEWKGRFYPKDLPAAKFLQYYGGQFGTVEINSTFFGLPKIATLEQWASQVPEGFPFAFNLDLDYCSIFSPSRVPQTSLGVGVA